MTLFQLVLMIITVGLSGLFGLWVAERNPPTIQVEASIDQRPYRPGQRFLLHEVLERHKVCGLKIEKMLYDSEGVRYQLSDENYVAAPGPVGIDKFSEPIRIPRGVASGPARVRVIKVYYCNPLHNLWPVFAPVFEVPLQIEGAPLEEANPPEVDGRLTNRRPGENSRGCGRSMRYWEWEPANTAPKDGTRVLFFVPNWDDPTARIEDGLIVSGAYDADLDRFVADVGAVILPSHWQLIPRLPLYLIR